MPLVMKVPILGEGEDPAAIVSFEMEQMILPRLSGPHVPKFVAAGDFAKQPYIVMELIEAPSLRKRLSACCCISSRRACGPSAKARASAPCAGGFGAIRIRRYARQNPVDQIVIGARQNSLRRKLLGGVSAKVAAEAVCTASLSFARRARMRASTETELREVGGA